MREVWQKYDLQQSVMALGRLEKNCKRILLIPKKILYLWWLAKPSASTDVCTLHRNRQKAQFCQKKQRTFKTNSRFSGSKYRSVMRIFRIPYTFRFFKVRSVRCLKQMEPSDPLTGSHISEEQISYRTRLDDEKGIISFTFSQCT